MLIDIVTLVVFVVITAAATLFATISYLRIKYPRMSFAKDAAHSSGQQLRTILDNISEGVITLDPNGGIKTFNSVAERIFGFNEAEVLGKNADMLLSDISLSKGGSTNAGMREAVGVRKSGATFQVDLTLYKTENMGQPAMVAIVRDVTERKQAEQRMVYLAQYDALTGLPTRTLFHDRASHALARAHHDEKLVAIMYLDLDNFKHVNDLLGHHTGDQLLKAVAQRITSCLRDVDTVSRMGGDEFTVILESIPHIDNATIVAQKIVDTMQESFYLDGQEVHVTVSIGVTVYPFDDKDLSNLLKDADTAMYRAKQAGRNGYQLYGADMAENAAAVKIMEKQVEHALERGELLLHYQPRVDVLDGKISGVEALLRWQHPDMGLIAAKDFMPLLERSKLIYTMDEWVLRAACLQNYQWQKIGLTPLRMTVNISPYRFRRKGLVELVSEILKETSLLPEYLELDIPAESQVGIGKENYREVLSQLSNLGIHVALADNGVGSSFIDSFQRLPPHVMKIDRASVQNTSTDRDHAALVEAVVALARAMKLKVIAEGVETVEQLNALRGYGCDLVQGFLFSKAVPNEEITLMLREGKRFI